MPRVVLVIPCYNEASRLDCGAFLAFSASHPDVGFLLVNDGSVDETLARLRELADKLPPGAAQVLDLQPNRGKAEAVRQGVLAALEDRNARYVGYWDADLATPLEELDRFLEVADARPELLAVTGARVGLLGRHIERSPLRHYLGRLFATGASLTLRLRVYDTQCGAKLFRVGSELAELFSTPFCVNWTFDVELLARLCQRRRRAGRAAREAIYEIPLMVWRDVAGSKVGPRDFFVGLFELVRVLRRYPRSLERPERADRRAA